MADIVNLNKARKAKIKQSKTAKAAENRVLFGLPGHEKARARLERDQAKAKLSDHRLANGTFAKTIDEDQEKIAD